jgi:uncharacterized membrane protein
MTQRISLALLLLLGAALAGPVEYTFIPLPRFDPARSSQAVDINDVRQVSGLGQTTVLPGDRAVIWTIAPDNSATVMDIGLVAGRRMFGRGLNNHGHMTGFSWVNGDGEFGFRYTGGSPVLLENTFETPPDGGTFHTVGLKINDDGWISGYVMMGTSNVGTPVAALWDPSGAMHTFGTLGGTDSAGNDISLNFWCGTSEIAPGSEAARAFRWDFETGTMEGLDILPEPGHFLGTARGVNNHGDVCGVSSAHPLAFGPNTLGVVWYADGSVRKLDAIGTPGVDDIFSGAAGINDAGWVVGSSSLGAFSAGNRHPILWLPDETRIDLLALLPAGALQAGTASISNTGWICGGYVVAGILHPYVLRPTPATQIAMLMDQVDRLDLGRIGRGLNLQLKIALGALTDGRTRNDRLAAALLAVFAREVRLLGRWRMIDAVQADSLLAVVDDAVATLNQ